jgi:hypothetical protein
VELSFSVTISRKNVAIERNNYVLGPVRMWKPKAMARPAMEQTSSTAHRREKWRGKAALRKEDYKRHRRCSSVTKEVTPRKAESCEREACQCQHELWVIGNSDCEQITKVSRVRDRCRQSQSQSRRKKRFQCLRRIFVLRSPRFGRRVVLGSRKYPC